MTLTVGTGVATSGTTSNSPAVTLADPTVGACNVLGISANSTSTGIQPQIIVPTGWTLAPLGDAWKTGSPSHEIAVVYRFFQSGDATTIPGGVAIGAAGGGNIAVLPIAFSTGLIDTTTPIATGESQAANSAGPTTNVTSSITLGGLRYVLSGFGNRTGTGSWAAASDGNIHDPILGQIRQPSAASIAMCGTGTTTTSNGGARSLLAPSSTSVNNTFIVAFNPASGGGAAAATASLTLSGGATTAAAAGATGALGLTGSALAPGNNATATLSLTGGAAPSVVAATANASVALTGTATGGTPAQRWVRTQVPMWIGHRDGFASTLGEETLEGYTAAAAQLSTAALEVSVWDTSDGVYVACHDSTTGRVFSGTNYTINSTTWATLSPNGSSTAGRPTTIIGGNPLRRIEEILDAFPGRIFVIENKHGTNEVGLAALLDAHVPGRWIFKGPYNDTANANTAASHSAAPMWLYFYPSQLGSLSSTYSAVSSSGVPIIFGLGDYDSAPVPVQADANTFFAFTTANGIPSWAHILNSTTEKTTADSQATTASTTFNGYMVNAFSAIAPTDANTATASLTLTGNAADRAAAGGSAALAITGNAGASAADTATAALTLAATASAPATGMATGGLALTGAATFSTTTAATLALSSAAGPAAADTATAALTLTAAANAPAAGASAGSLTLSGTGSGTSTGAPNGAGQITLTGTASPSSSPAAASALLSLASTAIGASPAIGSAVISLTGTSSPATRDTSTGTVTLFSSATSSGTGTAAAALALTGNGNPAAADLASATITFTATGAGSSPSVATATLTLGGTATRPGSGTGTALLTLTGSGLGSTIQDPTPAMTGPVTVGFMVGPVTVLPSTAGPITLAMATGPVTI